MASVTFDHVTKRFNEVIAVNDLNIGIEDKEFLVLVGPSGCGKSTALRCLAGLEDISEGQIRIGDQVVNDVPPKDRDIAMVFQSYALYPHMSVYDNMAFGLKLRKTPKEEIKRRVEELPYPGHRKTAGAQTARCPRPAPAATWDGRSCVSLRSFYSTNRSPTWMPARGETRANINKLHQQLNHIHLCDS
jgi:multiple sugar transport system ATP-binding protein